MINVKAERFWITLICLTIRLASDVVADFCNPVMCYVQECGLGIIL